MKILFFKLSLTHSLRVTEGVQPSCGASWAREVAGTCIACEVSFAKAFLVFFPSPRWEGFAVHPASWTDSVLLSYLAREHIVFAFQMPRALWTALFRPPLNSSYWPLTMYICLNQTLLCFKKFILGLAQPSECYYADPFFFPFIARKKKFCRINYLISRWKTFSLWEAILNAESLANFVAA